VAIIFSGPGTVRQAGSSAAKNQEEIVGMASENVTCPKCGHKNSAGSQECVKCGVIFARFYEFLQKKSQEGMKAAAKEEQLKVEATAADEYEDVSDDSELDLVQDLIGEAGDDAAVAETATEGRTSEEEVEITIDENSTNPRLVDGTAAGSDSADERRLEADGMLATETLFDLDSSVFSDAMTRQNLAQSSAESEVNLSAAGDQNARPAAPLVGNVDWGEGKGASDHTEAVGQAELKEDAAKAALPVENSQLDSTPAGTLQAKTSGVETEDLAKPALPEADGAGRADAESESVSGDDEVLVLVDLIPEIVADSAGAQADSGKDQNENPSAKPESEPVKKLKAVQSEAPPRAFEKSADPEHKSSQDWRSKVKHAMAAKRDLRDIIRAYEGQSIAINYYDSTQVQEAELIFVNNLFFSAFVKNQNLLYSFPLHTIISVAEKIDSESGGKSVPHARFPAVITISPPSYL
jgi:hypothetical protein